MKLKILLLLFLVSGVLTKKIINLKDYNMTNCYSNNYNNDFCKDCSKKTKILVIYPLCCEDLEINKWCKSFKKI